MQECEKLFESMKSKLQMKNITFTSVHPATRAFVVGWPTIRKWTMTKKNICAHGVFALSYVDRI